MRSYRRFVITIAILAALWVLAAQFTDSELEVESGTTLLFELSGTLVEAVEPTMVARLMGDSSRSFASVLSELRKAERDDRLAAVILRIRDLEIGWGKAQELRTAIQALDAAGRRTVAYVELSVLSGNVEYFVASAASEVHAAPANAGGLIGLAAQFFFFGGMWEKLGVGIEVEGIGEYKSAGEMLSGREMSEAHREMANSLLDSTNEQFIEGIVKSRGLTPDAVQRAIDGAPSSPGELLELKLIDRIAFLDETLDMFGDAPLVRSGEYARVEAASVGFEPKAKFALVYGSGSVVVGEGSSSPTGGLRLASDTVSKALEDAAEDDEIDAIIFRIDSPGGSPLAADMVWRAVEIAKQSGKPLIASFSDVAASGGYYVACGADAIVAPAASLVGSIGVFVMRPVLAGLFEKLDIGVDTLTRGAHADLLLSSKPLTESGRALLHREIASTYALFKERVGAGRGLDPEEVEEVARGRVWTAAQAVEIGLVDAIGGLREAAIIAKEKAGLEPDDDVALVPFPKPRTFVEQLADSLQRISVQSFSLFSDLGPGMEVVNQWMTAVAHGVGSPQLLPPFLVEIR